jgi:hypothetical protein
MMTDIDIQDFVSRFAAAWAAGDPEAFLALWHPNGILRSPLYDRPVLGKELGRLTEIVKERAPDSVWQLLDWTARMLSDPEVATQSPLLTLANAWAGVPLLNWHVRQWHQPQSDGSLFNS